MRKLLILLLSAMLLVVSVAGCGKEEAEGSGGKEAKEILRVGMECAYAPFNWTQTSKEVSNGAQAVPIYGTKDFAYGYDVMVAQQLADEMGMTLQIHKVEWSSIILGMNAGDYDVILAGMGYTKERDNSVDFTRAYYIRDNVLIVKKDGPFASGTGLSDFDGASATTQIGTLWEQLVPQIPNVKQMTFLETTSEVVMAVATGTADCAVLDEPTAISAALSNPNIMLVKLNSEDNFILPEGVSLDVCVAVKEGNKELQDRLDAALDAIEWDEAKMLETMDLAVKLQPLSN